MLWDRMCPWSFWILLLSTIVAWGATNALVTLENPVYYFGLASSIVYP